jgi:hypothetical protein
MSQDSWLSPELVMKMGSGPPAVVAGRTAPGSCGGPFGNELGTDDRDLARGIDSEPYLATLEPDDRHTDVVADKEFFHQLPRQHQHGTVPLGPHKLPVPASSSPSASVPAGEPVWSPS